MLKLEVKDEGDFVKFQLNDYELATKSYHTMIEGEAVNVDEAKAHVYRRLVNEWDYKAVGFVDEPLSEYDKVAWVEVELG